MLESLRSEDIEENQRLLVVGFKHAKDPAASHVILDGHTVIETPTGLTTIDPEIFEALGIEDMIFLASPPTKIFERRAGDANRQRPPVTLEAVRDFQEAALLAAFKTCLQLQIPLVVIDPTHIERLDIELFADAPMKKQNR
jgi:adenylate kinase